MTEHLTVALHDPSTEVDLTPYDRSAPPVLRTVVLRLTHPSAPGVAGVWEVVTRKLDTAAGPRLVSVLAYSRERVEGGFRVNECTPSHDPYHRLAVVERRATARALAEVHAQAVALAPSYYAAPVTLA